MPDLQPCPFCGGTKKMAHTKKADMFTAWYECTECNVIEGGKAVRVDMEGDEVVRIHPQGMQDYDPHS